MKFHRLLLLIMLVLGLIAPMPAQAAGGVTKEQEQQRAIDEMNRYRRLVGVQPTTARGELHSSAWNHARYVLETGEYGHTETQTSSPYYTGYKPKDRAAKYGYSNSSVTENWHMAWLGTRGTRTYLQVDNALRNWMAGIYHRFPLVSPRTEHAGYGPYYKGDNSAHVFNFGNDYGLTGPMTRWPLANQTGVGTEVRGESPSPIEQFAGSSWPTGYPVSLTWYRGYPMFTSLKMVRAGDGMDIPGYSLDGRNDKWQLHRYSSSISFIPKAPLAFGTKYTVTFQGKFNPNYYGDPNQGTPFTHTWSFTTMPAPGRFVGSSPSYGATGVSRTPSINLYFNQPVRAYTLVHTPFKGGLEFYNAIGISVRRVSDGAEAGFTVAKPATATTKTVTFKPTTTLAAHTRYRVTFRLADAWGRPYSGTTEFTTGP